MMKTRLYGLLALVLCAMMVAAPVAAMGTDDEGPFVTFTNSEQIVEGTLICNTSLTAGGNGLTVKWRDDENATVSKDTLSALNESNAITSGEVWKVTQIDFTPANNPNRADIHVSKVKIIDIKDYTNNGGTGDSNWNRVITTTLGKYKANASSYDELINALNGALQDAGYTSLEAYYEISPYMEYSNGDFYIPNYDKEVYPPDGSAAFQFTLPVDNANINSEHDYAVAHGYTGYDMSQGNWVAYLATEVKEDTDSDTDGVQFGVSSLSPFAVGYKTADTTNPGGGGNGGGGNNGGGNNGGGNINPGGPGDRIPAPADPAAPSAPSIPQTGDNSQLALWFALAALSLTGAVLALRRRKA